MSNHSEAGKGSKQRPTDLQKFEEGFERIFGKKEDMSAFKDAILNQKTTRIDIIGQNGNDGIHYDSDSLDTVTTNDEYDDKRKNF